MNARRLAAAVAGAWCVVTACAARPRPSPVVLQPCQFGRLDAECGSIAVFENRVAARGRRIDVYFAVARADAPGAREALFVFAGGPGDASTSMAGGAAGWLRPIRASLDIVFVDQRGTGRSHPLACESDAAADPAAAFGHVFDPAWVERCRKRLEPDADLTEYTTDLAVADVDDVREALGYSRVSLYGVSYGTRMAQAYARRYPSRVRSMVIDGVVPFDNAIPVTYARSAQDALDDAWRACADSAECRTAHPHQDRDFAQLLRRFDGGPLATHVSAGGVETLVRMSRGDFGYAVRGILYSAGAASRLPEMVGRALASGDLSEFATAYWTREASMERALAFGLHLSVLCAEDVAFPTEDEIQAATAGTFLGPYLFDEYRHACQIWPRGAIAADARTPLRARVPSLLISGAFDPVTPPSFSDRVAQSLPLSRTIVVPDGAHGSAAGCPREAVLYVLEHGTLEGMPAACR